MTDAEVVKDMLAKWHAEAQAQRAVIDLDANGLPVGHGLAFDAAAKELTEVVNELPDSFYRLGPTDAQWVMQRVLERYLGTLQTVTRLREAS